MNKVAVVTGASGQLGPIWCETLNEMGHDVFKMDLPECDVSERAAVQAEAYRCIKELGAPDVVVLNAAIDNPPSSKATIYENMERIIAVNLMGANYVCEAFAPLMAERGEGLFVGIVSIMARIGADWRNYPEGFEKPCAYGESKAALESLSRHITALMGRYNVRFGCLGFGTYDGGKLDPVFLGKFLKNVPLGRPVSRESLKASLRFAVTCPEWTGSTVMVDGGYTAW